MKTRIFYCAIALMLASCQKEIITDTGSIQGETISNQITVSERVRLLKAGAAPYQAKYSDSALRIKYGTLEGSIVFAGNSYVEGMIWANWEATWKGYPVINRGLGGTTWAEVIPHIRKLITDYKPKVIVLYSGENEYLRHYGANPTGSRDVASTLLPGFNRFYDSVRAQNPKSRIILHSMLTCPKLYVGRYDSDIRNVTNVYPANYPFGTANWSYREKILRDTAAAAMNRYVDIRAIYPWNNSTLWASDSIHPKATSYINWFNRLKPIVDTLYKTP